MHIHKTYVCWKPVVICTICCSILCQNKVCCAFTAVACPHKCCLPLQTDKRKPNPFSSQELTWVHWGLQFVIPPNPSSVWVSHKRHMHDISVSLPEDSSFFCFLHRFGQSLELTFLGLFLFNGFTCQFNLYYTDTTGKVIKRGGKSNKNWEEEEGLNISLLENMQTKSLFVWHAMDNSQAAKRTVKRSKHGDWITLQIGHP